MPPRGLWPWTTTRKPPPKPRGAWKLRPPELSVRASRDHLRATIVRRLVCGGRLRVESLLRDDDTLLRLGIGGFPEKPPPTVDVLLPREWPEDLLVESGLPLFAFRPNLRARVEREWLRDPQNHVGVAHLAEIHLGAGFFPGVLHTVLFTRPQRAHWGGPVYPEDDAAVVRYAILVRRLERLGVPTRKALVTASFAYALTRVPREAAWRAFPARVRDGFFGDPRVLGDILAVTGGIPRAYGGLETSAAWHAIRAGAHPKRLLPWIALGQLTPQDSIVSKASKVTRAPLGLLWQVLLRTPVPDPGLLDAALAPYRGEVYFPPGEPAPDAALEAWWREVGETPPRSGRD